MTIDDAIQKLNNFAKLRKDKQNKKENKKLMEFTKLEINISNLIPKIIKIKTLCELFAENNIRNEQLFFNSPQTHHLGFGVDKIVPLSNNHHVSNNRCLTPTDFFGCKLTINSNIKTLMVSITDKQIYYNGSVLSYQNLIETNEYDDCIKLMRILLKEFFYYEEKILLTVERFKWKYDVITIKCQTDNTEVEVFAKELIKL